MPEADVLTLNAPRPVRVLAVTSGKGGVGKTTTAINLALALQKKGNRVVLLDGDMGLANVDLLLGLKAEHNLSHVLAGECSLPDVLLEAPGGFKIVPGASGIARMAELSATEHAGLVYAFSEIGESTDVLIIDTPAGIASSATTFSAAAQEILVIVCDEPASITDAYAMIKVLNQDHGRNAFQVVVNNTRSRTEGEHLFKKLLAVTERFLDVSLELAGSIPNDDNIRVSAQRRLALLDAYPLSPAALAFKKLADSSNGRSVPRASQGNLEFFLERLIGTQPSERIARV